MIDNNKGRTLVLGDLHGALKALKQALERANITIDDTIIFIGDYVDGWGDTPELIEYLIDLNEKYNCIFIRGNHDEWCEKWFTTTYAHPDWLAHGGITTKSAYENSLYHGKTSHMMFFYKLHRYYIDDKNRLFVHGGYLDEGGVKNDITYNLIWNRSLFSDAYLFEMGFEEYYPKRCELYNEIFVGHSTTLMFDKGCVTPLRAINIWNVDTGAGSNGRVTIMDVDTKKYWQSDKVRSLYPDDTHNEFCKKYE